MRKRIRERIALLVVLTVCLWITGCGNNNSQPRDNSPATTKIDIDMSRMSDVMAHAQAEKILESPEEHVGKTFKIKGKYQYLFWEEQGRYYSDIVIDSEGTCPKFFEIVWDSEFPDDGEMIEIIGVFGMYDDGGHEVPYIEIESLVVV